MDHIFIEDLNLQDKRVLIRADLNVPLDEDINIRDNSRIDGSLKTIRYVLDQGAKVILMSHLGRPKGKRVNKMSLNPVAVELSERLGPGTAESGRRRRARNQSRRPAEPARKYRYVCYSPF